MQSCETHTKRSELTSSWAAAFGHCMESMPQVDFPVLKHREPINDESLSATDFETKVCGATKACVHSSVTSGDPPSALTCGTRHAVPSCELHIGKLGDISTFPIFTLRVLQRRGQTVLALIMACLLSEVGKGFPHSHTCKTQQRNSLSLSLSDGYKTLSIRGLSDWLSQGPMESSVITVNSTK